MVSGIAHYGNCFGVPTVGGECIFEPCYDGNPLVNVFALGVCRKEDVFYAKAAGVGNPVIYVGARTGRDGIHGASMASAEFTEESKQKRPNVQVGDPFMEKLLLEACLEAMKTGAIVGIQDMGAAGLTCSTCEMGSRGERRHRNRAGPRAAARNRHDALRDHAFRIAGAHAAGGRQGPGRGGLRGVPQVGPGGRGNRHGDRRRQTAREASWRGRWPRFPIASWPTKRRSTTARTPAAAPRPAWKLPAAASPPTCRAALPVLLAAPDLCSKRWIWQQYDYQVRTNTVAGPGRRTRPSSASRRPARRSPCRSTATAATRYLSPREGAKLAVAEACRNLSTVGARPVAATNCLNFGNPERPEIMAQLVEAIEGMAEACRFFDTPITGGNVSLYNETLGEGIYPTPVLGIVGVMKTAHAGAHCVPATPAARVMLLGGIGTCDDTRFGGTQYAKEVIRQLWGLPPALDLEYEQRVQYAMRRIIEEGLAESAHDLSDGGLGVALAECSFGPAEIGAQIELDRNLRPEVLVFHEAPSRILISTADPKTSGRDRREIRGGGAGGGGYNREGDRDPAAQHDAGFLGDRRSEIRLRGGARIVCSISSTKNAGWWPSTAIRKRPSWPTSGCTRCSIADRKAPASAPPTASEIYMPQVHGPRGGYLHQRRSDDAARRHWPSAHTRYSTAGDTVLLNAQPFSVACNKGRVAVAHNGNITNATELRATWSGSGSIFQASSDTEVILHLLAHSSERTLAGALRDALLQLEGAFSLVFLAQDRVIVARDPHGFRPLAVGRNGSFGRPQVLRVRLRNLRVRPDRRRLPARRAIPAKW